MDKKESHKVPEISIDEALKLYLSMAFPQGLPEGEEGERIINTIKAKIASERPEWARASGWQSEKDGDTSSYSQLKQKVVEEASKEELPEDPEERYLHLRRKEAAENSELRREEKREEEEKSNFRKALIEKKSSDDEELKKRAALIKKVLLERASKMMVPDFSEHKLSASIKPSFSQTNDVSINHELVKLEKPAKPSNDAFSDISPDVDDFTFNTGDATRPARKPDAKEWFKDFKSLSVEDRMESIIAYNQKKRDMLENKQDLMWDRRASTNSVDELRFDDDHLDMNYGLSFKPDQSPSFDLKME